ncbi:MAG: integration host factor subunit beta [Planctomycetes bacterium]|nr:integration host factor subunit beta [Planctomycetota bacterium]
MTKREIVKSIAERTALTQSQASDVVQLLLEAIVETVVEERRVELRNFGVFELKSRRPRKARNPRTGEVLIVPERLAVVFRPGRAFEEQLAALEPR